MFELLLELKARNAVLFWFGLANLLGGLALIPQIFLRPVQFAGVNAWYKPLKFALSIAILSWTVAWYIGYLPGETSITSAAWTIVVTLGFEIVYIGYQASLGKSSHFNVSTPVHRFFFGLMALAAAVASLSVGVVGLRFFASDFPQLPDYYVWAIRFGFILFVVFSFQGFAMGSRMAHTVGAADGTKGLPFLNWSLSHGDLRVAHFVGMHALQVLPLLSYYVLKSVLLTFVAALAYGLLAVVVYRQALRGKPVWRGRATW